MYKLFIAGASALALALSVAGCVTTPTKKTAKSGAKAPILSRSTRPVQPEYMPPPRQQVDPQVDIGQLPREDPLTPREYANQAPDSGSGYPTERYTSPPPRYADDRNSNDYGRPPAPPWNAEPDPGPRRNERFATQNSDRPPNQAPSSGYGAPANDNDANYADRPPSAPQRPDEPPADFAGQPPAAANRANVAVAPPASAEIPAAPTRPATPAQPSALPPTEITREGNDAVVALLDSADKYVKAGQLDNAGAALERALRIEPRNAGIWHDLAQIRLHQGQYQQAESLAGKSNNLASGNQALQARNWKLIAAARKASGNPAGAQQAEAQAGAPSN